MSDEDFLLTYLVSILYYDTYVFFVTLNPLYCTLIHDGLSSSTFPSSRCDRMKVIDVR